MRRGNIFGRFFDHPFTIGTGLFVAFSLLVSGCTYVERVNTNEHFIRDQARSRQVAVLTTMGVPPLDAMAIVYGLKQAR